MAKGVARVTILGASLLLTMAAASPPKPAFKLPPLTYFERPAVKLPLALPAAVASSTAGKADILQDCNCQCNRRNCSLFI